MSEEQRRPVVFRPVIGEERIAISACCNSSQATQELAMTQQMMATRAAGQARLEEFAVKMGRDYAQGRNFDRGPGAHRDV